MKKYIVMLMIVLLSWGFMFSGAAAPEADVDIAEPVVAAEAAEVLAEESVRDARLLHMLELNQVFDDSIYDTTVLMEESAIALVSAAQEGENGFMYVRNSLVESLVLNLYGRVVDAADLSYEGFPSVEGMLMVLPRGLADISHNIISVTEEDGTIRTLSCMTVTPHDGEEFTTLVETTFIESTASSFGYVITAAEILG